MRGDISPAHPPEKVTSASKVALCPLLFLLLRNLWQAIKSNGILDIDLALVRVLFVFLEALLVFEDSNTKPAVVGGGQGIPHCQHVVLRVYNKKVRGDTQ